MGAFGSGTFGSSAFGAGGGPLSPEVDLSSEFVAAYSPEITALFQALADAFAMASTPLGVDLPNLVSLVEATGSAFLYRQSYPNASDSASFSDVLQCAWMLLLESSAEGTATPTGDVFLLNAIVDTLLATGTAENRMEAVSALAAAAAMESLITQGWSATAVDSADFQDAFAAALAAVADALDAVQATATPETSVMLTCLLSEALVASGTPVGAAQLLATASDELLFYGTFNLGGSEYAGWVLNSTTKAASQYTNYPFESLVFWRGKSLGAGAGGIFEHTGSTDDGADIPAYVRTGLMDFGTGKLKNVPDVWVGFKGDGRLVLKVVTTHDTGAKVEDWYISDPDTRGAELREGRFQLGRGVESRYWGWTIHNVGGGDLELSEIALRPVVLSRRR